MQYRDKKNQLFMNTLEFIEREHNIHGDDMGIYKELDDKVYDICYRHGFNVQTRVGNDLAYYAFFIADDRLPKVQEAIQMVEKLGLRRINNGTLSGTIHYYTIDFH